MRKLIGLSLIASHVLVQTTKAVQISNKDVTYVYGDEPDNLEQVDADVHQDEQILKQEQSDAEASVIETIPGSHIERAKSDLELEHQKADIEKFIMETNVNKLQHHGEAHNLSLTERPDRSQRHLTVHLVPFSRTDLYFIKTMDEYYSGTNMGQHHASARTILSGVVDQLSQDPKRRFSFAEVKFLQMWYTRQNQENKDKLKKLIQNGQFEVVNGGWSSPDEACPSFEDLIDNMMIAHSFLQKEFGVTPKIGWNIESFGHSSTNARLFAQLGYDAQFFGKVDQELIDLMKDKQELTFMWNPESSNSGEKYQIMTHILEHGSYYPDGFYQDVNPNACKRGCGKDDVDPFVDDIKDTEYNAPDKSKMLINYITQLSQEDYKKQNDILIPMGGDWTYENTQFNFRNMEGMKNYIEKHYPDINMEFRFSTPSEYVRSLKQNLQTSSLAVYKGDFYPYIEGENSVWSGFFSSRPDLKKQIKDASAVEHAQNKFLAQRVLKSDVTDQEVKEILDVYSKNLDVVSIAQDHSTITGDIREIPLTTETSNLQAKLDQGNKVMKKHVQESINKQTGIQISGANGTGLLQCQDGPSNGNSTVDHCPVSMQQFNTKAQFLVMVYNPQGNGPTSQQFAKIKLPEKYFTCEIWNKQTSTFDQILHDTLEQSHYDLKGAHQSDFEMYIPYTAEPGDITVFKIKKVDAAQRAQFDQENEKKVTSLNQKSNEASSLTVLGMGTQNEVLFSYSNPSQNLTQTFGFNLKKYAGRGNLHLVQQNIRGARLENIMKMSVVQRMIMAPEGVLTFKEQTDNMLPQNFAQIQDQNVILEQGRQIEQYTIKYDQGRALGDNEQAIVKIKFSPTMFGELIKFEVELSPLPTADQGSRDVTVNWKMFDNFDPQGQFWTDSNELEMQNRRIDKQEWLGMSDKSRVERIPKNYFPVDSAIAMRDMNGSNVQVTIMNDRPQGGSAGLSDKATIELMQQRRIIAQDKINGLDESLNETSQDFPNGLSVNAEYNMQIFKTSEGNSLQRSQQIKTDQPPQYFFAFDFNETKKASLAEQEPKGILKLKEFPTNFPNFAFQAFPLGKQKVLFRFENLDDKFDNAKLEPQHFNLEEYVKKFWIQAQSASQTQAPNPIIREMQLTGASQIGNQQADYKQVEMQSMSIRVFEVDFSQK